MGIVSNKQLKQYFREQVASWDQSATPKCAHFDDCGGCALQHLVYQDQLKLKLNAAKEIYSEFPKLLPGLGIEGSPHEYGYRLKMDYVVSEEPFHEPHQRLGLRKRKQFRYVIDLSECHLIPPEKFAEVRHIYDFGRELGLENYDLVSGKGFVRYYVVRQFREQAMLNIVTKSAENSELIDQLANKALETFTSVNWVINDSKSDLSTGSVEKNYGTETIPVDLLGKTFQIGAHSFFQNNIQAFEELMKFVKPNIKTGGILYDLYSGVGTIGVLLASEFDEVIAVEILEDNHSLAEANASNNAVTNVSSILQDVGKFISEKGDSGQTVVVDPPRIGLDSAGVEQLLKLEPEQIIYISCNPITQAKDLIELSEHYQVEKLKLFDLYPQTLHMEAVAILSRKSD